MATQRRPVDVEDLVIWACGELARKRPPGVNRLPPLKLGAADRAHVGKWEWPMGFPSVSAMFAPGVARAGVSRGDPPHPDALIVEEAILDLQLWPIRMGLENLLGIDAIRAGIGFDVDAAGALEAACANVQTFILVSGRLGKRPALPELDFISTPVTAPNGKPGVWRKEVWDEPTVFDHAQASREAEVAVRPTRKDLYPTGSYGKLEWSPDPQSVVNDRAEYLAWRVGIGVLVNRLRDRLESRIAMEPRAAGAPWLGHVDGGAIPDLFRGEGVYAGEEAASLAAERVAGRRRPVRGGTVYATRPARPDRLQGRR